MTGIRDVAGVDARQWLTLTRAQLTLDLRQRSFGRARLGRPSAGATGLRALAAQALLYAIYGLVLAMVVRAMPDVLLAGIVLTTLVMFVVGTTVVLDHAAALTTTGDYAILGFRPVTSRTYFAARLTNVLIYTTLLTTMVAWLPVASLVVFRGVAMGVAGCAAIYAASFSTAFALLLVYAWMLRLVGSETLKRALGYVQMAVSFVVYGGYFAVNRVLTPAASGFRRPQTPWIYAAPPTWFAGYLDIASGHATPLTWALAAGTVALLAALALAFGGRTSAEFSEHLSDLTVAPARTGGRRDAAPRAGWWFRSGEARAVALLVRSQFRNDQRFKMGVLGILPMTLIYVFEIGRAHV